MSLGSRAGRGSKTRDPRTDPARAHSAPAPPGCRNPCACRWRPPPAIPGCPPADIHRSSSISCRSVSELTSPRRRTRAPQPNVISMTLSRPVRRGRPSSGAISTGTIAPLSTTAFGNSCRRHRNSWLLFTSWRRATIDTDAPGASVSATIWRFNASEYCRRFVGPGCGLVSTNPIVDTCSA